MATGLAPSTDWAAVREEATAILRDYLRIDTTNPPGNETPAARFLQDLLRKDGIESQIYEPKPGRGNLVARLPGRGGKRPFMLMSHSDVVPADRATWSRDPFGGDLVDGEIWGRGSLDMKGQGVMHLLTFLLLKRQRVPLDRDLLYCVVADEEVGGADGARWMVENHWDKVEAEYVLSEGGGGRVGVLTDDDRAVFAVAVAEKRVCWLRLVAKGTAGHGSRPHDDNPNVHLVRALNRVLDNPTPEIETPLVAELKRRLGKLKPSPMANALQRNTVSLTTLKAGVGPWDALKVNVIPSRSEATLDCRLLPGQDAATFIETMRRIIDDPRIEIIPREGVLTNPAPPVTPHDDPFFRAIEEVLAPEFPGKTVVAPLITIGGTDSRFWRPKGTKCYGLSPTVMDQHAATLVHNDDERIKVSELERGTRLTYEMVRRFCAPE